MVTAIIAGNICNQIIEFQNAIATRAEGSRFPTMQEVGLLCKLINCLDKLKKFTKQTVATQALNGFMRFLAKEDKDMGKLVRAKFKEYSDKTDTTTGLPDIGEMPATAPWDLNSEIEQEEEHYEQNEDDGEQGYSHDKSIVVTQAMLKDPSQPLPPLCSELPVDAFALADNLPLMGKLSATPTETVCIKGVEHNVNWIQYTLFQCALHPDNRRHFADESNYHNVFNHTEIMSTIRPMLQEFQIRES